MTHPYRQRRTRPAQSSGQSSQNQRDDVRNQWQAALRNTQGGAVNDNPSTSYTPNRQLPQRNPTQNETIEQERLEQQQRDEDEIEQHLPASPPKRNNPSEKTPTSSDETGQTRIRQQQLEEEQNDERVTQDQQSDMRSRSTRPFTDRPVGLNPSAGAAIEAHTLPSPSLSTSQYRRETFGDRPGIVSPPDTLVTSARYNLYDTNRTFNNERFLIEQAAEKKFNLVINLSAVDGMTQSRVHSQLAQNGFHHKESGYGYSVHEQGTSNAKVTLNFTPDAPPTWNEDTVFLGPKSAHMRDASFSRPPDLYSQQLVSHYRDVDAYEAGVIPSQELNGATGMGGNTTELHRSIFVRSVFSSREGNNKVRHIPTQFDINAFIEGGNLLSNAAEPGKRIFLLGTDAVALTTRMSSDPTHPNIYNDTKQHLERELGLLGNDRLIIIPQRTFHLDMSLTFTGEKEVVLADSLHSHRLQFPGKRPSDVSVAQSLLENSISRKLRQEGISVIRKPWSGTTSRDFNLFNGEFVKSNDTGKMYFLTNGIFNMPDDARKNLESDIEGFYADRNIEVALTPSDDASNYFDKCGGIGCLTNGLHS